MWPPAGPVLLAVGRWWHLSQEFPNSPFPLTSISAHFFGAEEKYQYLIHLKSTKCEWQGWLFGKSGCSTLLLVFSTVSDNTRGRSTLAQFFFRSCSDLTRPYADALIPHSKVESPFQGSLQHIWESGKVRSQASFGASAVQLDWIDRIAGIASKSIEKILQERGKLLSQKCLKLFYFMMFWRKTKWFHFKHFIFRIFLRKLNGFF